MRAQDDTATHANLHACAKQHHRKKKNKARWKIIAAITYLYNLFSMMRLYFFLSREIHIVWKWLRELYARLLNFQFIYFFLVWLHCECIGMRMTNGWPSEILCPHRSSKFDMIRPRCTIKYSRENRENSQGERGKM